MKNCSVADLFKDLRGVIFDMDGLLLDSEPAWFLANEELLKKRGHTYTKDLSLKIIGTGQLEAIEIFRKEFGISDDPQELIRERKENMYSHLMQDIQFLEGAIELIRYLYDKKLSLAIATGGHSVEKVWEILEAVSVHTHFSHIVSSDEVARGKPHPDIFLEAARRLNLTPHECIIFEDAVNGVMAAKRAGIKVIAVNKDEVFQKELKNAGADIVTASLLDIMKQVQ